MIHSLAARLSAFICLSLLCLSASGEEGKPVVLTELGTATVEETLAELRKDPTRRFVEQDGWIVAEKRIAGGSELWSFVPEEHEAYPSAVQRVITDGEDSLAIAMSIQCDAAQGACERLSHLFAVMNENLIGVSKLAPEIRDGENDTAVK